MGVIVSDCGAVKKGNYGMKAVFLAGLAQCSRPALPSATAGLPQKNLQSVPHVATGQTTP